MKMEEMSFSRFLKMDKDSWLSVLFLIYLTFI